MTPEELDALGALASAAAPGQDERQFNTATLTRDEWQFLRVARLEVLNLIAEVRRLRRRAAELAYELADELGHSGAEERADRALAEAAELWRGAK